MFGPGFDSLQLHFYSNQIKLKAIIYTIIAFCFLEYVPKYTTVIIYKGSNSSVQKVPN